MAEYIAVSEAALLLRGSLGVLPWGAGQFGGAAVGRRAPGWRCRWAQGTRVALPLGTGHQGGAAVGRCRRGNSVA